jgi:dTDP-4-dehydrorhamnose 3,5-epimerase
MLFEACRVHGARLIVPSPHVDDRGRFMRAWCATEFREQGIDFKPEQANMAFSARAGTLRGLHYQVPPAVEAKVVRCTRGAIFDVVVDLRPESPTYLHWDGAELSAKNGRMLYVPERCAHGCLSMEDETEIYYLTSVAYAPECARGVRYDDPAVAVKWPRPVEIVSKQDREWPSIERPR